MVVSFTVTFEPPLPQAVKGIENQVMADTKNLMDSRYKQCKHSSTPLSSARCRLKKGKFQPRSARSTSLKHFWFIILHTLEFTGLAVVVDQETRQRIIIKISSETRGYSTVFKGFCLNVKKPCILRLLGDTVPRCSLYDDVLKIVLGTFWVVEAVQMCHTYPLDFVAVGLGLTDHSKQDLAGARKQTQGCLFKGCAASI